MKKTIYYVMSCSHLTGDSSVKFYKTEAEMRRAYDTIVMPILATILNNELQDLEDEAWYHINDTNEYPTWGGFRVNSGEDESLDELLSNDANWYYQWGIVELDNIVNVDNLRYFASFSEYVDESTITIVSLSEAQSLYNNTITEHFDLASTRNGFHIDRNDKDTWFSDDDRSFGRELFTENNDKTEAYFGYFDVTETIRYGRIELEPTIVLDGTGSMSTAAYGAMHTLDFGKRGEPTPQISVHIAYNPDNDSIGSLLEDPIISIHWNHADALDAVKNKMTEQWWEENDKEPSEYVSTHIIV